MCNSREPTRYAVQYTATLGHCSFCAAAPKSTSTSKLWNNLPFSIRNIESFNWFKKAIRTFYWQKLLILCFELLPFYILVHIFISSLSICWVELLTLSSAIENFTLTIAQCKSINDESRYSHWPSCSRTLLWFQLWLYWS